MKKLSDTYFCLEKEDTTLYGRLKEKIDQFHTFLKTTERDKLWRECLRTFYSGYFSKGEVIRTGEQGERRKAYINHLKNLLTHLEVLTLSSRPTPNPRAINADHDSQAQCILARNILNYYRREKRLETENRSVLRSALCLGEGWSTCRWDGKIPVSETVSGDIVSKVHMPWEVARDPSLKDVHANQWFIVTSWENRFDIASKYPKVSEEVLKVDKDSFVNYIREYYEDVSIISDSDLIPVHMFYHKKTSACPEGKEIIFTENGIILENNDLPYDNIPVYYTMPDLQLNSNFGYTVAFDLLPMQKVYDGAMSAILTNLNNFGINNILAPADADVDITDVTSGSRLIAYKGDREPKHFAISAVSPELVKMLDILQSISETISSVSAVIRGNPPASLQSGAALALVETMTVRFNSALQQSYVLYYEDLYTGIIDMLKNFADNERQIIIAGRFNKTLFKTFNKDNLASVSRVLVDIGNPLMQTDAGRKELADIYFKMGVLSTPDEYLEVVETGNLEPLVQSKRAQLLLIQEENEKLLKGEATPVVLTDDHYLHIKEHALPLSTVEARGDIKIVEVSNKHLEAHINILRSSDADLLKILGQEPVQAQPAVPPMNPQTLQQVDQAIAQKAGQSPMAPPNEANLPNLPNLPKLPSGKQWTPQTQNPQ